MAKKRCHYCGKLFDTREDEGEIQFRRLMNSLGIGIVYTGKRQAQAKGKMAQ